MFGVPHHGATCVRIRIENHDEMPAVKASAPRRAKCSVRRVPPRIEHIVAAARGRRHVRHHYKRGATRRRPARAGSLPRSVVGPPEGVGTTRAGSPQIATERRGESSSRPPRRTLGSVERDTASRRPGRRPQTHADENEAASPPFSFKISTVPRGARCDGPSRSGVGTVHPPCELRRSAAPECGFSRCLPRPIETWMHHQDSTR